MIKEMMEKNGDIEVICRCTFDRFPRLKRLLQKKMHNVPTTKGKLKKPEWNLYKQAILDSVGENSIVLIHSSMDGLKEIGIEVQQLMDVVDELLYKNNTVVVATFPVTNLREPTPKSVPYNPQKTLCWTGLFPNEFIARPDVIRTPYPFNSLAACGLRASEMMERSFESEYVYDNNSPWAYCVRNNAKILFLGAQAHSSNTVAIHMVPDLMGEDWPIQDWYEEKIYKVRLENEVYEKKTLIQKSKWYKYCKEYETNRFLRDTGVLIEKEIAGCYLGVITDSQKMVDFLIERCKKGKLMYGIPRKYYKGGKRP